MATRVFSDEELARLRGFPEITAEESVRFFTLSAADVEFVDNLLPAHHGIIRRRHLEAQTEQAWCLTLATDAVVTWTTEYYGGARDQMRAAGRRVDDEVLAHISPAGSGHVNFFGAITVDVDHELATLDPSGYGPLREHPVGTQ